MPAITTIEITTNTLADGFGGLTPNSQPLQLGHNDQYDAYRHALVSAELTRLLGSEHAKSIMDKHETDNPNPAPENNMDRWNNRVGREEYELWLEASDSGNTNDSLEKWIYDRVKNGTTINDPFSSTENRIFQERQELPPSGECTPWDQDGDGTPDWMQINPDVNNALQNAINYRDPLAFDLDGNGIQTLAANGQVLFDQNADGTKEGTGWVAPGDGFLVIDKNGNGLIDNGANYSATV